MIAASRGMLGAVLLTVAALPLAAAVDGRTMALYGARVRQMIPTTFAYCSLVVVGALFEAATVSDGGVPVGPVAAGVVAMALVVWGQWFINDVYDKETDKRSNPDRPTTTGAISDREALLVGSALVVVGGGVAAAIGRYALAWTIGYVVVNTAYTVPPLRTKDGGVSSMVTLGVMGGFSILLGSGTVADAPTGVTLQLAVIVLAFMAINMSYKDLKDADDDERSGVENFAVRYGAETVRRAMIVLLPLSYLSVGLYFEVYWMLPIFVLFAAYVVFLLYTWDDANDVVYKLDAINGIYLVVLGVAYYLFQ